MTVRVLVVEDSTTVRRHLCDLIDADPECTVVGEAEDGRQAIELCRSLRPTVITMDMVLPVMSGLGATEYIMAHCPTPILVVSSSFNRGEIFKTYDALAAGAVDAIDKAAAAGTQGDWGSTFLRTLKLVARVKVITHPRARLAGLSRRAPEPLDSSAFGSARPRLVAIGASTGGPAAIIETLRALPEDFALPIVIVLHIGRPFATAFAEWLSHQVPRKVAYATDGEDVSALGGVVRLALPDRHLVIDGGRLRLKDSPERHSCRPSVDVLFESLAAEYGPAAIACLLTGMGRDGAAGLLAMRRAGALTVAQDEATSVVYGMPREAALLGAAEKILPIGEIGSLVASAARQRGSAG